MQHPHLSAPHRRRVDSGEVPAQDEGLADSLKALGHPKRLLLLRYLTEPRSLEQISRHLKVARQSAQEHLDRLLDVDLVERRQGRGEHGPLTKYVILVPRLFDIYERFGSRAGMVAEEIGPEVRGTLPTTKLPIETPKKRLESPRLIIVHGMRVGHIIPLQGGGPWLIGRDPHASLCLDYDPYVSHRHAEIRKAGPGYEVTDALSSNGILVDWAVVPRGGSSKIENGSLVRVGKTLLLFRTN
jgi:DNA-binding transcriptional ArsR family regulator